MSRPNPHCHFSPLQVESCFFECGLIDTLQVLTGICVIMWLVVAAGTVKKVFHWQDVFCALSGDGSIYEEEFCGETEESGVIRNGSSLFWESFPLFLFLCRIGSDWCLGSEKRMAVLATSLLESGHFGR